MDAEDRRLKNRVRQQRYRARKREEKAKKDSNFGQGDQKTCHGALPQCLPLLGMHNVVNELPALKCDMGKATQEKNMTGHPGDNDNWGNEIRGYTDHGYGAIETYSEGSDSHPIESRPQQQTVHILKIFVQGHGDTSNNNCHPSFQAPKPSTKMEDGHHLNTLIKHGRSKSLYDIMACRLKNRERQRRYRAQKRLEADVKSADVGKQCTSLQSHKYGVVVKLKARVHHNRDWKKDARQAHLLKEQKIAPIESPVLASSLVSEPTDHDLNIQSQVPMLEVGEFHVKPSVSSSGYEANDLTHRRRHWKAAARNKVD